MIDFITQRAALDIGLTLLGLVVLIPLIYWHGRKRWLRGWSEEKIKLVGLVTFVIGVAAVATYKIYVRG